MDDSGKGGRACGGGGRFSNSIGTLEKRNLYDFKDSDQLRRL